MVQQPEPGGLTGSRSAGFENLQADPPAPALLGEIPDCSLKIFLVDRGGAEGQAGAGLPDPRRPAREDAILVESEAAAGGTPSITGAGGRALAPAELAALGAILEAFLSIYAQLTALFVPAVLVFG